MHISIGIPRRYLEGNTTTEHNIIRVISDLS